MLDEYPRCPYCHVELDYIRTKCGVEIYSCPECGSMLCDDGFGGICSYEPMSDDDFELADFCRGGDLTED